MNILISGGCKNGKSSRAQEIACELAAKTAKPPVYFATMIPHDGEDEERIQNHREDRKNLGFETIETGADFMQALEKVEAGRVILFDSLTALLANEQCEGRSHFSLKKMQEDGLKILQKIEGGLEKLIKKSDSLVFVSDTIFCDGKYDEITELYKKTLAQIENFVAKKCDKVYEMVGKMAVSKKISILRAESVDLKMETLGNRYVLVLGGAWQGKTAFAREKFSLKDEEIFVCGQESEPDFSKRCISHYENYVAWCLKHQSEPQTEFSGSKIIICDDIFCGIVPVDAFQRRLREKTGLALQKIAENAVLYRVFCGRAEEIK